VVDGLLSRVRRDHAGLPRFDGDQSAFLSLNFTSAQLAFRLLFSYNFPLAEQAMEGLCERPFAR
jgi:hypothetical protein